MRSMFGRVWPRLAAGVAVWALAAGGIAAAHAATLEVGADKQYKMPSQAAAAARDGDHIRIAAGEYFDCAIWRANNLVIEGASPEGTVITDKVCQGKALFITAGNNITIRNLTLTRARVPDMNGAGIRAEGENLTIDHVRFINDQDGILSAPQPNGKFLIRDSEFIRNGTCEGGACAHGIYIGPSALLRVERTRFFETKQGHHIKSRAQETEVIDCDIADGPNGTASYEIEVPNGGGVMVRGNHIQKGPKAENHTGAVVIGAEGVTQRTPQILVENNTFEVDGDYSSFLVVNLTATPAELKGNKLRGNAKALRGDGTVQ